MVFGCIKKQFNDYSRLKCLKILTRVGPKLFSDFGPVRPDPLMKDPIGPRPEIFRPDPGLPQALFGLLSLKKKFK